MASQAYEKLLADINGYMRSSILAAMAELDLATILLEHGNKLGAADLARLAGADERGCRMLLDALVAHGYFAKTGTGDEALYGVCEEWRDLLDSRRPDSFIPFLRHSACCQRSWSRLGNAVKSGEPQIAEASFLGPDEDQKSFIMGMNSLATRLREPVLEAMQASGHFPDASVPIRVLDLGGASGTYTEALLDMLPLASATIFDLPVGIARAREKFSGHRHGQRVSFAEGDFTSVGLPPDQDFVWLSAIIHQMDRQDCRRLYAKIFNALKSGGILAIRDFVMEKSGTCPPAGTLFALNMLVQTERGRVYTLDEIGDDLRQCGFEDIDLAVKRDDMGSVVVARKP